MTDRVLLYTSAHNNKITLVLVFLIFSLFINKKLNSQDITYDIPVAHFNLRLTVDEASCHDCETAYFDDYNCEIWEGISYDPGGVLYGLDGNPPWGLYELDPLASNCTLIATLPAGTPDITGLLAVGGGIFYAMGAETDILYRWDVNAGTISAVGSTGFPNWHSEICMSNGNAYYLSREFIPPNSASVIRVDLVNPANSVKVVDFNSSYGIFALTASPDPNSLYTLELWLNNAYLYRISLLDGSLTEICEINPAGPHGAFPHITSPLEHDLFPLAAPFIELDCDDSSGATGSDFNTEPYDCLSEGTHIIDIDPRIRSDAIIAEMTVKILPVIPDFPDEILDLAGTVPGINATGLGTPMLTFTNTGSGTLNGFLEMLSYVVYLNKSFDITPGLRTIEVQFTSQLGTQSNKAKAFIDVDELPQVEINLGPDITPCEGESVLLSVNNPEQQYLWSTGDITEAITVTASGIYAVTVTSTTECPNRDTIEVTFIPVINLWLTGDTAVCPDESVNLILTTDATFPIDVTITPDPGTPFELEDIMTTTGYVDIPFGNTEYYITGVFPSQPACVVLADPDQIIEIWQDYNGITDASTLCLGDSIQLGNTFVFDSGVYNIPLETIHGCDSLVTYTITLLQTEHLYFDLTTCDPSESGTVLTFLPNPNGCDTVVHTTTTLLQIDTTDLAQSTCLFSETGIMVDTLTNQFGCDSFLITSIIYDPPQDTTQLQQFTCDSAAVGVFYQTILSASACDSIIETTYLIPDPDTTLIFRTNCDTSQTGVESSIWNGQDGCDSIVITTTMLVSNDTTFVFKTSCDSADLGVFLTSYPLADACDSFVITQVDFSLADSTFLINGTCSVTDTGLYITPLTNQFGCDSIVLNTVNLFPSYYLAQTAVSCFPSDTGLFTQFLLTQFGCDSVITTHTQLLPSNNITLDAFTCDPQQAGQFLTILQNQFGCDSTIIETITYLEPDTTIQTVFTCDSLQIGVLEMLWQNQSGCDSLVQTITALYQLPELSLSGISDYNGFHVSCFGASDASLLANVSGTPPISYSWSTGDDQPVLHGVPAGIYAVSIADGHGCKDEEAIELTEPPILSLSLIISEPDCFENDMGLISLDAHGGVPPYSYSIDSLVFTNDEVFEDLAEGIYKVYARDDNDCITAEIIAINIPFPVQVDLGENQILDIGDSYIINAMVNVPVSLLDSIRWLGIDGLTCDTCLQQFVAPIVTSTYSIEVINEDGCQDRDEILITVVIDEDIYVPTVFSPNGDGINDEVNVILGSYIEKIISWEIFDRWGNQVYSISDEVPNSQEISWDGTFQSKDMNPAVYAYRLVVQKRDGNQVVRFGDVTLIR